MQLLQQGQLLLKMFRQEKYGVVPARKIGNIYDLARKRLVMINERESIGNFTDLQR